MAKDTKDRILATALELFSQNGYAGTNIRELTAALGLVKSSMYKHFSSKEEVWSSLLDRISAYYDEQFFSPAKQSPVPDSTEELVELTMRLTALEIRDETIVKARKLLMVEQYHDARARELAEKFSLSGLQSLFSTLFAGMMDKGLLCRDDPDMLAFVYAATIASLIQECDREPEKVDEAFAQLEAFLLHFINTYGVHGQKRDPLRILSDEEIPDALQLSWTVFRKYQSPDCSSEGTAEFKRSLNDPGFLAGIRYYGAFDEEKLVGVLGIRVKKNHICLFFVDGTYHRRGIGTALFRRMLEDFPGRTITVNSSPFARPFYKALGFRETDSEWRVNGIRFTPMVFDA